MKVKQTIVLIGLCCLTASMASAQHGVALLGTYQDAKDGDSGYGGSVRYQYDLNPKADSLRFLAQVGYLTGFGDEESIYDPEENFTLKGDIDADIIPLEIAALYDFAVGRKVGLYAGAGAGYYLTDSDLKFTASGVTHGMKVNVDVPSAWYSYDMDDEFGFFGLIGVERQMVEHTKLFAEVRYTYLKIDTKLTLRDPDTLAESDSDSEKVDLSGIGVSLGFLLEW